MIYGPPIPGNMFARRERMCADMGWWIGSRKTRAAPFASAQPPFMR